MMIADAVLYAAGRATGQTAEKITRTVVWYALAAFAFTVAAVASVLSLFWFIEPQIGAVYAALLLAVIGFILTAIFAFVPTMIHSIEVEVAKSKASGNESLAAVETEVREAVDYFGAAKVLISAFLLGLGAARSLKGR
jgi:hypothetical protein